MPSAEGLTRSNVCTLGPSDRFSVVKTDLQIGRASARRHGIGLGKDGGQQLSADGVDAKQGLKCVVGMFFLPISAKIASKRLHQRPHDDFRCIFASA